MNLVIPFDAFISTISSQGLAVKKNAESMLFWGTSRNHKATQLVPHTADDSKGSRAVGPQDGKQGDREPIPIHHAPETFGELSQPLCHRSPSKGIISHFTEGKRGPEKTRSTKRVQLRQSLNSSLLTWDIKALSELDI